MARRLASIWNREIAKALVAWVPRLTQGGAAHRCSPRCRKSNQDHHYPHCHSLELLPGGGDCSCFLRSALAENPGLISRNNR